MPLVDFCQIPQDAAILQPPGPTEKLFFVPPPPPSRATQHVHFGVFEIQVWIDDPSAIIARAFAIRSRSVLVVPSLRTRFALRRTCPRFRQLLWSQPAGATRLIVPNVCARKIQLLRVPPPAPRYLADSAIPGDTSKRASSCFIVAAD